MISMQVFDDQAIIDGDVTFAPFIHEGRVGYKCTHANGRVEFLYLNPSCDEGFGGPDDGPGNNVFIYQGPVGDPAQDEPVVFLYVFDDRPRWPLRFDNPAVRADVAALVHYSLEKERADYEESKRAGDDVSDHIYTVTDRLRAELAESSGSGQTPVAWNFYDADADHTIGWTNHGFVLQHVCHGFGATPQAAWAEAIANGRVPDAWRELVRDVTIWPSVAIRADQERSLDEQPEGM